MSKLITRIKRLALALCLATPFVSWAATTYSTDYSVTGSETAYTSSAGNANVYWQNFNFRAAVDKDNLEHGYYFFLKDGDTDIGETDVAVKLDSITLTWGSNAGGGIGASDTPYLVVTTADDTPVIIGVSEAGGAFAANGTSTFSFSDVVLASNAKYRFYFYKNDVSSLSVGTVLTGAQQARINGRYHNKSGDARADYNDIRCSGGTGYSINCSFVVSPLEEGDAVVLETGDASIPLAAADTPVVVEGKVVDGAVDVGSEVAVDGVLTVCGEATTLVLTDSLTATAFYFPATVTIDASAVSGLDPTGDDSSKTTTLLSGALKYMTAPTVVLPAATAGMIYETNVTASGISVTAVKGVDCVETITGNTSWSTIKPTGWINSLVGDKPAIAITYESEDPVTLTFDEAVTAGALTLTGNIVVEASEAATFGTVTAGAGSVVEMANMTITTQSGSGVYRYRTGYPSTVPNQSLTYEYVGTADSENPGTVNLNGMRGTVKTTGYMSITGYYPLNTAAHLDVVSGTTSVNCGDQAVCGYLTVREGATLVNVREYDALDYDGYSTVVNVYGTLDMGNTRWTSDKVTINLYGGTITGNGQGPNGALDFKNSGTVNPAINVYADSTISASVKFRNTLTDITVSDGVTLTLSGVIRKQADGGGITKKGAGTLKFTTSPVKLPAGIVVEGGTLAFDTEDDVDQVVTYTASVLNSANMDYVSASNWKGRVVVSAVAAGTTATQVALDKTGNANSYLTLNGISGNAWCAGSNYTVQPEITLAGDVNFQDGYSKMAVTFRKIAAGTGNLSLKSWSNCTGITYGFTTLDADNYTGTIQLDGSVLTFNVGDILKANAQPGDKVLPLTVANNATVNLLGAKVNGEAADLEVKEDGIYIAVPVVNVTITVPDVLNATVVVSDGSTTYEPTTEGGASYVVPEGANITATYTADEGYSFDGATSSFELLNVAEGDEVTVGELVAKAYVVQVGGGANVRKYTSLSAAMSSLTGQDMGMVVKLLANVTETSVTISTACQMVQLNGDSKTLTADVVVPDGAILAMNNIAVVGDVSVAGGLYMVGATGIDVTGGLTLDDGATIYYTTLREETPLLTVSGEVVVEGDMTVYQSSSTPLANGTYKLVTGESVDRDETATVTVSLNGNPAPGWSLSNTETTLLLAVAAASVDGVNYATFEEAVDAANGVETIELLSSAAYQLAVDEKVIIKAGEFTFTATAPEGYVITSTSGVEEGVVVYTTAVAVAKMTRRYNDSGSWIVNIEADYATVAEAIAATEDSDNNTRYTVTLLAATAADITVGKVIAVEAGNNNVTGTITVTADGATVTVPNEPTLGADTWVTARNNGTITVGYGATRTVTVSVTGEGTAALETGDLVKATETAGTYSVKDGTSVKLTAEFGDEYKVDETSTYTNPTGTNTLPQPAAQQDYVMVPVNGNTTISVVIVLDTVSFEVAAVAGTTVVVMDGAVEVVPVAGVYTIPVGNTVQITWVEDADHIVTNGQTDWITPGDGTTVAAPAGMTVEDVVATIGSAKYASLQDALNVGGEVTLLADVASTTYMYVGSGKTVDLDLNGKTITSTGYGIVVWGTLTVDGGTINAAYSPILVSGGTVTVDGGTYTSTANSALAFNTDSTGGTLTINDATVQAQEFCVLTGLSSNNTITINGGTFTSIDNAVIGDNGTSGYSGNEFTINAGTFNGGITSANYIACGIYVANDDTVTVNGGTFNITGGCGIAVRAGVVTVADGVTIAATGTATGWVGDKKTKLPCAAVIYDVNPGAYPGYDSATSKVAITGGTLTSDVAAVQMFGDGLVTTTDNALTVAEGYKWAETATAGVYQLVVQSQGIDPDDPESKQEVVIDPTGKDEEQIKEAAVEEATVTIPEAVSPEAKAAITDYKSYFELKATVTNPETGACAVEIVGFKDDVVQGVNEDAVEALKDAVADTTAEEFTVEVPAGLYYVVETYEALGTPVDSQEGWSTGTTTPVDKPTGTTQGFIRVRISTAEITD